MPIKAALLNATNWLCRLGAQSQDASGPLTASPDEDVQALLGTRIEDVTRASPDGLDGILSGIHLQLVIP